MKAWPERVDCTAFVSKSSAQSWHNGEAVRRDVTLHARAFDAHVAPSADRAVPPVGPRVAHRVSIFASLLAWCSWGSLSACSLVFPAELSQQPQDALAADAELDADGTCSAPYVCFRFARREVRNDATGVSAAIETLPYDPLLMRMEAAVEGSDWQSLEKVGAGTYRFARPRADTPYRIGFQLAQDPALHSNALLPREMFGSQPAPIAYVEYIGRRDRDILPASSTASVAITSTKFETAFLFTTGLWSRTPLNGTHSGGAYQVRLANTNQVSPRGMYDVRKGDRLYLIDWGKPTSTASYSRILRYAEPTPDFSSTVNVTVMPALITPAKLNSAVFNDEAGSEAARVAGLQAASQAQTSYEIGAVVAPNAGELGFLPLASGSPVLNSVVEYANPLMMQTIVHRLLVSVEQAVPRVGGGTAISVKKVTQHTY